MELDVHNISHTAWYTSFYFLASFPSFQTIKCQVCILSTLSPHDVSIGEDMKLERQRTRSCPTYTPPSVPHKAMKWQQSFFFSPGTGTTSVLCNEDFLVHSWCPAVLRCRSSDRSCLQAKHKHHALSGSLRASPLQQMAQPKLYFSRLSSAAPINPRASASSARTLNSTGLLPRCA